MHKYPDNKFSYCKNCGKYFFCEKHTNEHLKEEKNKKHIMISVDEYDEEKSKEILNNLNNNLFPYKNNIDENIEEKFKTYCIVKQKLFEKSSQIYKEIYPRFQTEELKRNYEFFLNKNKNLEIILDKLFYLYFNSKNNNNLLFKKILEINSNFIKYYNFPIYNLDFIDKKNYKEINNFFISTSILSMRKLKKINFSNSINKICILENGMIVTSFYSTNSIKIYKNFDDKNPDELEENSEIKDMIFFKEDRILIASSVINLYRISLYKYSLIHSFDYSCTKLLFLDDNKFGCFRSWNWSWSFYVFLYEGRKGKNNPIVVDLYKIDPDIILTYKKDYLIYFENKSLYLTLKNIYTRKVKYFHLHLYLKNKKNKQITSMIKCDENKIFASLYNLVILIDIPNFQIQLYIEFKNKISSLCLLYNTILIHDNLGIVYQMEKQEGKIISKSKLNNHENKSINIQNLQTGLIMMKVGFESFIYMMD